MRFFFFMQEQRNVDMDAHQAVLVNQPVARHHHHHHLPHQYAVLLPHHPHPHQYQQVASKLFTTITFTQDHLPLPLPHLLLAHHHATLATLCTTTSTTQAHQAHLRHLCLLLLPSLLNHTPMCSSTTPIPDHPRPHLHLLPHAHPHATLFRRFTYSNTTSHLPLAHHHALLPLLHVLPHALLPALPHALLPALPHALQLALPPAVPAARRPR